MIGHQWSTTQGSPVFVGSSLGIFPGDVFGAVMSVYFLVFAGIRSVTKAIALVVTSTCAYFVALCSGVGLGLFLSGSMGFQISAESTTLQAGMVAPLLIAGVTGAFLVLAGVLRLYSAETSWRRVLKTSFLWSLPGGLLALVGWGLGPTLGKAVWSALESLHLNAYGGDLQWAARGGILNGYSLHIVWQIGMGILLGVLLSETTLAPAAHHTRAVPARTLNLGNACLFGVMVLALAWFIIRWLPNEYREMRWQRAYAGHVAAKPSSDNLPQIETAPADAMLILTPIGEYLPERAIVEPGHFVRMPTPQVYSVRYSLAGAPTSGPNVGPHVDTQVQEWPNAAWARWALEEQNVSATLNGVEQPVKFGQRILMRGRGVHYYYAWPSDNRLVVLECDSVDPDEFLKKYLEKYPSSL